jgi:hypothetical protein
MRAMDRRRVAVATVLVEEVVIAGIKHPSRTGNKRRLCGVVPAIFTEG